MPLKNILSSTKASIQARRTTMRNGIKALPIMFLAIISSLYGLPIKAYPQNSKLLWTPIDAKKNAGSKSPEWHVMEDKHPSNTTKATWRVTTTPIETDPNKILTERTDDWKDSDHEETNRQILNSKINESDYHVTGGVFHIKRNNDFLPAITHFIPSGFGASFGHVSMGLWLEDCLTAGGKLCGGNDKNFKAGGQSWIDEFYDWGKGRVVTEIGLGDPTKWFGLDAAFQFTSLATTRPGQTGDGGTPFGSGQGLDLSISRNITPDWGIKIGARNIAKFDNVQLDSGRSAYGVMSMRVDLGGNPSDNTNDLYLTWGLGNGRMRPLDAIVADQGRECKKDIDRYGKLTTAEYVVHCLERGFDYGAPHPIGSIAYMVNPQLSFIAEWWGRNLLLGASIKPFEDINWVISPAVTSILHNSDWDPNVPGYTERMRFNLSTSIGF